MMKHLGKRWPRSGGGLGPPVPFLTPFLVGSFGSPTKIDYRKKSWCHSNLSNLEDLVDLAAIWAASSANPSSFGLVWGGGGGGGGGGGFEGFVAHELSTFGRSENGQPRGLDRWDWKPWFLEGKFWERPPPSQTIGS